MNRPSDLTKEELVTLVESIRDCLYLQEDLLKDVRTRFRKAKAKELAGDITDPKKMVEFFDPDKEWDADVVQGVADVLDSHGLIPTEVLPITVAYPKKTR